MFSSEQLRKFAGRPKITQETFDEAVKENIEEFDMNVRRYFTIGTYISTDCVAHVWFVMLILVWARS